MPVFNEFSKALADNYTEPKVEDVPVKLAHEKVPVKEGGVVSSAMIPDQVFQDIAERHGVKDVQKLRDYADLHGALRDYGVDEIDADNAITSRNAWKSVMLDYAGLADSAAISVPSWIFKKMQKQNYQKAFDEVKEAATDSRSWLRGGADVVAGMVGGGAIAAKLGKAAATSLGAVSGLTGSETGEELSGLAEGAALSTLAAKLPNKSTGGGRNIVHIPAAKGKTNVQQLVDEAADRKLAYSEDAISWAKALPPKYTATAKDLLETIPGAKAVKRPDGQWDWQVWGLTMGSPQQNENAARSKILEYAAWLQRQIHGVYER